MRDEKIYDVYRAYRGRAIGPAEGLEILVRLLKEPSPEDWADAHVDLHRLDSISGVPAQIEVIRKARTRMRGYYLARLLVDEGVEYLVSDWKDADERRKLAAEVLAWSAPDDRLSDVKASLVALQGATLKSRGQMKKAGKLFDEVLHFTNRSRVSDPVARGHCYFLAGSFLKDDVALAAAEKALEVATLLYSLAEAPEFAGRSALTSSIVAAYKDDFGQALSRVEGAVRFARQAADPVMVFVAEHNQMMYWCDSGDPHRAAAALAERSSEYGLAEERGLRQARVHFHRLAGKIRWRLGELDRATSHLQKALRANDQMEMHLDAVLVGLELVEVLCDLGKIAEAVDVSRQLQVYGHLGLHREAVAAVVLVHERLVEGAAPASLLRAVGKFVEIGRRKQDLSFRNHNRD